MSWNFDFGLLRMTRPKGEIEWNCDDLFDLCLWLMELPVQSDKTMLLTATRLKPFETSTQGSEATGGNALCSKQGLGSWEAEKAKAGKRDVSSCETGTEACTAIMSMVSARLTISLGCSSQADIIMISRKHLYIYIEEETLDHATWIVNQLAKQQNLASFHGFDTRTANAQGWTLSSRNMFRLCA